MSQLWLWQTYLSAVLRLRPATCQTYAAVSLPVLQQNLRKESGQAKAKAEAKADYQEKDYQEDRQANDNDKGEAHHLGESFEKVLMWLYSD
jgi:hypothetical protein